MQTATTTGNTLKAALKAAGLNDNHRIPVVTFEHLTGRLMLEDVDVFDVNNHFDHFDAWRKKNRTTGEKIATKLLTASQICFEEYNRAPDGAQAAPRYFNLWHWFLSASNYLPWKENGSSREKHLVVSSTMMLDQKSPPRVDHEAVLRVAKLHVPDADEDAIRAFANEIVQRNHDAIVAPPIIARLNEIYGDPFVVHLRVDC